MHIRKKTEWILASLWLLILCVYWVEILCINFSQNPLLYCTDMYSDMIYASEVWHQKDIFPDGWVFGNQLYAVATPVLAALMFGITNNHCIAMGIASTVMGIGVILSFSWMIKPIFKKLHERLAAIVVFMTTVLLCADAVFDMNGWQLFFTMCSYYACYAVTAFLAFGCFLRRFTKWSPGFYFTVIITCVLSFGTGIQSLRQTAVMIVPLIAVAFLEWLYCIITKKNYAYKSGLIAAALSVSNFAGILYASVVSVEKNEIFGDMSLSVEHGFITDTVSSVINAASLFSDYGFIAMGIFLIACIYIILTIFQKKDLRGNSLFICLLLCVVSVFVMLAIDTLTDIYIRPRYYFILFPIVAILIAYMYSHSKIAKYILTVGFIIFSLINYSQDRQLYFQEQTKQDSLEEVSTYLEENDISIVYSYWNVGEKIAISSDFRIQAGFWNAPADVFHSVKYLCDPSVFDADPSACAYIVMGEEILSLAIDSAHNKNAEIHIMKYFPELDMYVFSSDIMLMD